MYSLAISPCPNDTFAFYALLHGKTEWRAPFELRMADIEELNRLCFAEAVDFCKISFHAYVLARRKYRLLNAGSALGHGCGPLIVAKRATPLAALKEQRIAVPGRHTTATLLLQLLLGKDLRLEEMPFDRIMPACAAGQVDAGLIIHESRFTYPRHGLVSLVDLGAWWERETGRPIPLGGIVAHKRTPAEVAAAFDRALGQSVAYALAHPEEPLSFMKRHAQEMEPAVMQRHVDLYVNDFTRDLGPQGHAAIDRLAAASAAAGIIDDDPLAERDDQ